MCKLGYLIYKLYTSFFYRIKSLFKLIVLHYFLIREILIKKFPLYEKKNEKKRERKINIETFFHRFMRAFFRIFPLHLCPLINIPVLLSIIASFENHVIIFYFHYLKWFLLVATHVTIKKRNGILFLAVKRPFFHYRRSLSAS